MKSRMKILCGIGGIAVAAFASVMTLSGDRIAASPAGGYDGDLRAQLLAVPLSPNLGGDGSVDSYGPGAFFSINTKAQNEFLAPFLVGQRLFGVVWEPTPGLQPTLEGLGPLFNRTACRECHEGNGRGQPPEYVGAETKSILVRISVEGADAHGGPKHVPNYGDQIQDRAVDGVAPEAKVIINYEEIPGKFADGTPYSLRQPTVSLENPAYGELPPDTMMSARVSSPVIGLGLLQAVPESTLRALADPDDENGDGISGRVNMVWDAEAKKMAPGRFGWKSNVPTVRHQAAGAALGDMGITSPVFTENLCEAVQKDCQAAARKAADMGVQPEFIENLFDSIALYIQLLAVPKQRNATDSAVQRGETWFRSIGCSGCHMPTLITAEDAMDPLAGQQIHPFTDLLLHDLGEGLSDYRPDFDATGYEWRTQPLWGIGHTHDVSHFDLYLHDGRARSLSEAILWHGGEAEGPREAFRNLPAEQRSELLAFLGSL